MREERATAPLLSLTSGPVESYPEVLRALSTPMSLPNGPYFREFYRATIEKLRQAMATEHMPVILQGEAVLGIEAAAASLIGRNDVVLNLASGAYGKGFAAYARRHAGEVLQIEVPHNEAIDPARVEEAFAARPDITIVSVVHLETPSGSINPVSEIGHIAHRNGALTIVDATSSWAGMDVNPDRANADIFIAGPHKCLGSGPGLTLMGISPAAWRHIDANPAAPRASFLSLLDWRHAADAEGRFPFIPSIAEINGLNAALDRHLGEGPAVVWARHAETAATLRAGLAAMGLAIWPAREAIAATPCTAVALPAGVEPGTVLAAARRIYGVSFSPGRGETADKVIVVGHMARTAYPIYALTALAALGGALQALGHRISAGDGIDAAIARNGLEIADPI